MMLGTSPGYHSAETCDVPGGLVALLDDVSIIARTAAASLDDIGVASSKAGVKAAGVVIDDAAVTPSYVTGLSPARELPIIWQIAKGSLKNKLLILLPGALLLSAFFPSAIVFILMLGGAYLSYEGAEKVIEKLGGKKHGKTVEDTIADPIEFEKQRVAGAVRTDLILSAEIMAITLNEVAAEDFVTRAGVLAVVGILITIAVYGAVGLIVKMDDVGLHLAKSRKGGLAALGRGLVSGMPRLLLALSAIGTVAMLWVGGGILLHGTHELGVHGFYDMTNGIGDAVRSTTGALGGLLGWVTYAALSALVALIVGAVIVFVAHSVLRLGHKAEAH